MPPDDEFAQTFSPRGGTLAWSALLIAVYLASAMAGWQRSLLEDEVWGLLQAERTVGQLLLYVRGDLVHPPLWYLVAHFWFQAFGGSDVAARTMPILFNLPTLILFPVLASRVTPHWRLASVIAAALWWRIGSVVHFSRMYGLLLLLVVVAMLLWRHWLHDPTTVRLAAWAGTMLLLCYTHYSGGLLLAGFLLANQLVGRRRWAFFLTAMAVAAAFLPWVFFVLPSYFERGIAPNLAWVQPNPHWALKQLLFSFLSYIAASWNPYLEWQTRLPGEGWLALIRSVNVIHAALLLCALGGWRRAWPPRQAERAGRWFWALLPLVLAPVFLLYVFSLLVHPALEPRFLLGVLLAYALLVVLLSELGGRSGLAIAYAIVLPWALGSAVVTLPDRAPSPVRRNTAIAAREFRPGDVIVTDCHVGVQVWWEWTRRLGKSAAMEAVRCDRKPWWLPAVPERAPQELHLADAQRVWLFFADEREQARILRSLVATGFRADPQFSRHRFLVLLIRRET